ncbi:MAG: ABC transporter ATP-binding protein [Chloroflexi bacterium]|nr:ABC transporter ATP-binding protein [Chloroflexota bacterium]
MSRVAIERLSKSFRMKGGRVLPVLREVTMAADDCEFVCLLGPSGCGKSTILNILAGLVPPDRGTIAVDNVPVRGAADGIGYVFQRPRLLPWRTVRDNLAFALEPLGLDRSERNRRIDCYLKMVGLDDFAGEYPLYLSGGMQQRVAIARAFALEPNILLMDEPFSSLDELTARGLRTELLALWSQSRKTVLFVTHNAMEAVFLADHIMLMSTRPSTVLERVKVELPRPRSFEDPALLLYQKQVLGVLGVTT